MLQKADMTQFIETAVSFPKLFLATVSVAGSAVISGASEALQSPQVHPAQVAVWWLTGFAAFATGLAALAKGYIEVSKYVSGKRARSRAKKRHAEMREKGQLPLD